jgi:hypothetical protein
MSRTFTLNLLFLALLSPASPAWADFLASSLGPNFIDGSVLRYDATGSPSPAGSIPSFTAGLGFSQGVTIGPDGNIYVSSNNLITGAGEILFFDPSGTPLSHAGGQPGLFATLPFNPPAEEGGMPAPPSPARLKFGANGSLYVADREGTTVRAFDGTTGMQLADAATGLQAPTGLAFGPDGALYVGNFNSGKVVRVQGGVQTDFITPTLAGPYTPSSLLWLQSGNLLVVDLIGNQVLEYDGSGSFVRQFAVPPPSIPDPLPDGVTYPTNSPSDIVFDEDGNLVLGLLGLTYPPDNRGALLRYDLDGNLIETMTSSGRFGIGALAWIKSADAITGDFDSDGDIDNFDYAKWKADFGKWVAVGGGADGNGNGVVDAGDYTVWRDALPGVFDGSAAGSAVPEPSSAAFAMLGLLLALGQRTRSRFFWN